MSSINNELQHPDYIWTWKNSAKGRRQSIWVPYLNQLVKVKNKWKFIYNGGECLIDIRDVDSILIYGLSGELPVEFLDDLNSENICLLIHRRGMAAPYIFFSNNTITGRRDLLTKQILARENKIMSCYVARTLIRERFHSFEKLIAISRTEFKKLSTARSIDEIRVIEANISKKYWARYYELLGLNITRRENHPVNSALDACSFFLHGILMRWVLLHHLSVGHGYLHETTNYTSLIYNLIEPYRFWFEDAVSEAYTEAQNAENLTARSIDILKGKLESSVYVPLTMQTVKRKSLLHGIVLSLCAWLDDDQVRFLVPTEGVRKGGRPPNVAFSMPGYNN